MNIITPADVYFGTVDVPDPLGQDFLDSRRQFRKIDHGKEMVSTIQDGGFGVCNGH